ncbi:putative signal-transduction protein with CBS domains [Methylobacterium sp. 4-46]|uniref:CBS domain-containing protein n=1 Tax=unclassified Methylobacterium TaxID=2615210 RepID=UPI000165C829|nr:MULTISPECIES: CBS domain-containing protein [Methylobacterium]ACA16258.1 putative signal-transduction protein with CBS domains [Methylobacterium sp. 4-46]WFT81966.1 CBS domain-containing protein [Methylobacterium nodulans]
MTVPTVGDVIAGHPLHAVTGSFTIASVCHRMRALNVGALAVLDEGRLIGIISERDIARRVIAGHRDPMLTLVREVMTREPLTIAAQAPLAEAHRLMAERGIRHLPVMRDEAVVGMISLRDIPAEAGAEALA